MIIYIAKYAGCNDCVIYNVRIGYKFIMLYYIMYLHNVIIFYGFKLEHNVYYLLLNYLTIQHFNL